MICRIISNRLASPALLSLARHGCPGLLCPCPRFICDQSFLRLDDYERERKKSFSKVNNLDAFWLRIFDSDNTGCAFEEDVKLAWYLVSDDNLQTVIQVTEKLLNPVNKNNLFLKFNFGAVMMRACYSLKRPDAALQIFDSQILFRQLHDCTSVIILMDLLIETGKPAEAARVYEHYSRLEYFFIVRNSAVPTLYAVALCKEGTPDAFEKASKFVANLVLPLNQKQRVENLIAVFALKLNKPEKAIKLVQKRSAQSELSWNIKIQGLVIQSNWNEVFGEIQQRKQHRLYRDTFELIHASNNQSKNLNVQLVDKKVEDEVMVPIFGTEPAIKRYF